MNLLLPVTVPDWSNTVPKLSAYQSTVFPAVAVANKLVVSGPHLVAPAKVAIVAGPAVTVAVTAVLPVEEQVPLFDST
jgi:hypothetical protein